VYWHSVPPQDGGPSWARAPSGGTQYDLVGLTDVNSAVHVVILRPCKPARTTSGRTTSGRAIGRRSDSTATMSYVATKRC
jgi:uncharacterized protein with von Willebrand factor type A (vWA) domain